MIKDAFDYGIKRVIIACGKTNLRLGKDGLITLIRTKYKLNPLEEGTLFMFCGSSRKVIKCFTFEGDGFAMITKYLTEGTYPWPATPDEVRDISREDYEILMNGFKVGVMKRKVAKAKAPTENIVIKRDSEEEIRITA